MRIDGQNAPTDAEIARRIESPERPHGPAPPPRPTGGDRVGVSADAQLIASAVQAATDAPAVRSEAVERGRRALESGTLGTDADRLAQRILDSLLGE